MKQILLIRHAKTEPHGMKDDFERELTRRGHDDCESMSARLKETGFAPDIIKASPARRTKQTLKDFSKFLGWDQVTVILIPQFYEASHKVLFYGIADTAQNFHSLVIVGHNPEITDLFNYLSIEKIDNLPTCSLALFEFDVDNWKDIEPHKGKLKWYLWPKKNS